MAPCPPYARSACSSSSSSHQSTVDATRLLLRGPRETLPQTKQPHAAGGGRLGCVFCAALDRFPLDILLAGDGDEGECCEGERFEGEAEGDGDPAPLTDPRRCPGLPGPGLPA